MEGFAITGIVVAVALIVLVCVVQVIANTFGLVDPSAAF